ncbi:MAG: tyrosine-type recombinase/integrase [bacterium]
MLNGDLVDLLKRIGQNGSEYIFTGRYGEPLKDVKKAFKTTLKKAGIADFRFHDLRHASVPLI